MICKSNILFFIFLGGLFCFVNVEVQASTPADLFNMSLEQLLDQRIDTVVTASKYEQKVTEAPSSITIITADEIRKLGYRTLIDILNGVRGFYKTYDRNYAYLGVRGFGRPGDYSSRILFLVDGYKINDDIGNTAWMGTEYFIDVDLIDRIEIIRGPGSALYGSNAFFAVINVITKKGADYKGAEAAGELSSFKTKRARLTYGLPSVGSNDFDFLVSGTSYDSDGPRLYFKEFDDPSTNNGWVRNDDDSFKSFLIKTSFSDFSLIAAHNMREKGIPTASYETVFGDRRTRTWDGDTLVGLKYQKEFSEKLSMLGRISFNQYSYRGHYAYDYGLNKDMWYGQWYIGEVEFVYKFAGHILTFGSEGQLNVRQDQKNWDSPADVYLDSREHSRNYGLYAADQFKITDNITLDAGVRRDWYDSFGSTVNPRFAAIVDCGKETFVKLLAGRAFRAPSVYERFYCDSLTSKSNENLRPETIKTYEVVIEKNIDRNLSASAGLFYYQTDNLISQIVDESDGMLVFNNVGEMSAKGFEAEIKGYFDGGFEWRLGYCLTQTFDKTTRSTLANSPRHIVNSHLIYPVIKDRLYTGVENIYNSERKTLAGENAGDFLVTNLTLTYENVVKGLGLQVGLYNLFDVKYSYPGFGEHLEDTIEQDGRTVGVKVTYRF